MVHKPCSVRGVFALLTGLAMMSLAPRADAQWADQRYQYRIPLSIANTSTHAFAAGDLVTATLPAGVLSDAVRPDGADVALFYNGSPIPFKTLFMGGSMKNIFALPAAIGASNEYSITENLNAGKTNYTTLPAGEKVTFTQVDYENDDATAVVTLPFSFPFMTGSSNKLLIGVDGYVVPGGALLKRYDLDEPVDALAQKAIVPYISDLAILSADEGVYYFADATQAVIRWEAQVSTGVEADPIAARFALILKPNGEIRFVYGSPVNAWVDYANPRFGVALGSEALTRFTYLFQGEDLSNRNDVLYVQNLPVPVVLNGLAMYYGGPSVSTPSAAPTGLVGWDFSDGQLHGWKASENPNQNGGPADDARIEVDPVGNVKSLLLNTPGGLGTGDFVYVPQDMAPLGPQVVYTKLRATTGDKAIAPLMRYNSTLETDNNAAPYYAPVEPRGLAVFFEYGDSNTYGIVTDRRAPNTTNGRSQTDFPTFGGTSWTIDVNETQYLVTANDDVNGATWVYGKSWQAPPGAADPAGDPIPGDYQFGWDSSTLAPFGTVQTGKNGLNVTVPTYLHWMWVVPNPFAERINTVPAAAQTAPTPGPGKAVVQGVAYDASIGVTAPMAGVTLSLKDAANNVIATSVTDATGRYRYVIDAGPTAAVLTITGTKPGSKGSATQSVVENNTYTVNVPIVFGARAQGTIYDTQTNGGIVGATVNLLTPGTSTVVFTTTTDANGQYVIDLDVPGTYDLAVNAGSYTVQGQAGVAYAPQSVITRDFGLDAPELLVNGGFETEAPVVDPAGYPGALRPAGFTTWDQQATAVTAAISNDIALLDNQGDATMTFYINNASRARTGTHSVAIKRIPGVGSTSVQWMSDTGSLIPVAPNQKYRVSLWANGTPGMQVRARIRFSTTNYAASSPSVSLTGSDTTFYADDSGGEWKRFSAIITAPSAPAFMMVRFYGTFVGSGTAPQVVYFDDVSVKAISPRLVTGTVVDASAAGVGNVAVGANLGRPGMTDPSIYTTSSSGSTSTGSFTLSLLEKGTYSIQAYAPGFMAGQQKMVDTSATYGIPEPITVPAPAVPAVNVAVAAEVTTTNAAGEVPVAYFEVPPIFGFDGSNVNRGNGQWSQARTNTSLDPTTQLPITVTADLGRNYTFSQLTWVWAWPNGGPQSYDILTSTDGTNFTPVYKAEGTGGMAWPQPGVENSHSCIQLASPVNARYVRMVLRSKDRTSRANLGFSEFRVDLPGATATGLVTKLDGTPINGAFVGTRGGSGSMVSYGTTDATGAYSVTIPTDNTIGLVAHYLPDGDNVVAISDPLDARASASTTTNLPTIKMADPVVNLVPVMANAYSEFATDESDAYLPVYGVDHVFTTRWSAYTPSRIVPDAFVNYVVDLGSPKTFNQANIVWGLQYAGWYGIDVSDDGTTWRNILTNHSNYSGYRYASDKYVDVESLPATTAQYIRVQPQWSEQSWADIFEFQLANVTANPPAPFALTKQALRIAAGLAAGPAAGADFNALNVVTTGASAGKVDVSDATALAKQAK